MERTWESNEELEFPLIPLLRIEATGERKYSLEKSTKYRVSINSTSKNRSNIARGFLPGRLFIRFH